jgi:hypothetical protein
MTWLKVLWQIIYSVITGKWVHAKSDAELNAERAQELGKLKAERDAYQAKCKAEADLMKAKLATEQRMKEVQERPPKEPRKAKAGQKLFLFLVCFSFIPCMNCVHRPPVLLPPPAVLICPEIPLPKKPVLPDITIPEPKVFTEDDATRPTNYCFTEVELDKIIVGIDELKDYSATLEDTIKVYNEGRVR